MEKEIKEKIEDWEKEFVLLENHLIILAEEQDEAIFTRKDKKESQMLWQDQINAIKDFICRVFFQRDKMWQERIKAINKLSELQRKIEKL